MKTSINQFFKIICCISFLLPTKVFSQEEKIILKTETGEINGLLTYPKTQTPVPVVLLIAGSGPTDLDGNQPSLQTNAYKLIAGELVKKNIATLRFDKRGIASSAKAAKSESELRFETYVNDVEAWISLLASDKRFSSVFVAGHSEGSLIGMIAAKNNSKAKGFISIAGAGRAADEILKEQLEKQPEPLKNQIFPMIDKIKAGDTIGTVPENLYALFRPSVQPYLISWFKYNPQTEIAELKIPVLLIQGTTDIQVTEKDVSLLAAAKPDAKKVIIVNMNHVLKVCKTKEQQDQLKTYIDGTLPLHKTLVKEMVNFIKTNTAK